MANILDIVNKWDTKRKVTLSILVVLTIASIVLLITWSQKPDYQLLYSNLREEDAGLIVQKLKEMKIPYKTNTSGILVPSDKVYELRIQLAAMGLPQGGSMGYEIFDKTSLGTTEFVQKVNLKRALQGELSRTIRSLQEVSDCRVHLSMPERSIFTSTDEKPKASVLLKLRPGVTLSRSQIRGIVHLVSGSVESLTPDNVTIVDNRGNVLTTETDEALQLNNTQSDYQKGLEMDMEKRIISIIEPVVGKDKVKAKASMSIDFTRTEETQETYDPDGQVVRSQQKLTEQKTGGIVAGVPGVQSNLPNKRVGRSAANKTGLRKQTETVNYEISKTVSHVIKPTGTIKRLTVAVLVDGTYLKDEKSGEMKYVARSEEDLKSYEDIIKRAVGYSEERGDEVKVINMPFHTQPEVIEIPEQMDYTKYIIPAARYGTILILSVLVLLFLIRPLFAYLKQQSTPPASSTSQTLTPELEGKPAPREIPRDEIVEWARNNPQQAATLIKRWTGSK
ncbi:Flagellar M-ring protein FliF [hydrothermal vent metagenome]|uniref:Flagellar M-ring protein FliF n=1 Tax=hydrothermal vent metagenome TaxID=652676 RepID=A0A3B1CWX3_9ZZZZ